MVTALVLSSCKYDDDDIWNSVHGLEDRVAKLEELCKQMNTNISSLQTIVTALQNNDYVTGVTPVMQSGKEVGYTITFSKSNPITIFHGKDGQNGMDGTDGKDGTTPTIGVKQDVDGIYYWTLDGDWLTDERGDKIKAEERMAKTEQMEKTEAMVQTVQMVKMALRPNSKSKMIIGLSPTTMAILGHR